MIQLRCGTLHYGKTKTQTFLSISFRVSELIEFLENDALVFNGNTDSGITDANRYAAIAWFAWRGETHIATVPLVPERHHPKPVFPELAPPEVLDSAGLDTRGRRA